MFQLLEGTSLSRSLVVDELAAPVDQLFASLKAFHDLWNAKDVDQTLALIESARIVKEMYSPLLRVSAIMNQLKDGRSAAAASDGSLTPGHCWHLFDEVNSVRPEIVVTACYALYECYCGDAVDHALWSFRVSKKGTLVCQPQAAQGFPYPISRPCPDPILSWVLDVLTRLTIFSEVAKAGGRPHVSFPWCSRLSIDVKFLVKQ